MNTLMMQMRHTAHELRVTLDHVLQTNEPQVTQSTGQDESMSFISEPENDIRAAHNMPEMQTVPAVHTMPAILNVQEVRAMNCFICFFDQEKTHPPHTTPHTHTHYTQNVKGIQPLDEISGQS